MTKPSFSHPVSLHNKGLLESKAPKLVLIVSDCLIIIILYYQVISYQGNVTCFWNSISSNFLSSTSISSLSCTLSACKLRIIWQCPQSGVRIQCQVKGGPLTHSWIPSLSFFHVSFYDISCKYAVLLKNRTQNTNAWWHDCLIWPHFPQ